MNVKNNKKAMSMSVETIVIFILVFLLLFGLIAIYGKVAKGNTQVLKCTANGGQCVAGTCDWKSQIPALSDKAAGCLTGELCCINITQSKPEIDKACENESNVGNSCGIRQYCTEAHTCVSQCEFCAIPTFKDKPACQAKASSYNTGTTYSCQCTNAQCSAENIKSGKCIPGVCPRDIKETTASDYMCCNIAPK